MPFRKSSNPEVSHGSSLVLKFKRQLSDDGKQLRRGSLGGALTGNTLTFVYSHVKSQGVTVQLNHSSNNHGFDIQYVF